MDTLKKIAVYVIKNKANGKIYVGITDKICLAMFEGIANDCI